MKIKGAEGKEIQVTFEGDKHPSDGVCQTISWQHLKAAIENRTHDGKILSLAADREGITIYWMDSKDSSVSGGLDIIQFSLGK